MRCLYCEDMQQERVEKLIEEATAYGCSTESIMRAVITALVSHAYDAEGKEAPGIIRRMVEENLRELKAQSPS